MSALPLETIDLIIGFVCEIDPSLASTKTCSLVSSTFFFICRRYIFANIVLTPHPNRGLPTHKPREEAYREEATMPMFQRLLSTTPEIGRHIRSLTYITANDSENVDENIQTIKKITLLRTFHLRSSGSPLSWTNTPLLPALLHVLHLPTLTRLQITKVRDFSIADLEASSNLQIFHADQVEALPISSSTHLPYEATIRLHLLKLGAGCNELALAMCPESYANGRPLIDIMGIRNMAFRIIDAAGARALFSLLGHCRKLSTLHIHAVKSSARFTGLSSSLRNSSRSLDSISLVMQECGGIVNRPPLGGLADEVEQMLSDQNNLRSLTLSVWFAPISEPYRWEQWGLLDIILTDPGWPNLKHVYVRAMDWECIPEETLRAYIEAQFPKLSSRNHMGFPRFDIQIVKVSKSLINRRFL